MQRHRPLSPPSRSSHLSLGSSRLPMSKTHSGYSRKRSHSPTLSPTRKLQREYEMKIDRYQESRKETYDDKRDLEISRKSRSSAELKYKTYTDTQDNRGSYSVSHESRLTKSSTISRERPQEHDLRVQPRSGSSRREPSPLYSKEVAKSYHSPEREKRYYDKNYDSQRRNPESTSYDDIFSEKQIRGRERSASPGPRYKASEKDSGKLSYRREDLEKIMVDIRRVSDVKDPSPTRRAIVRPEEVKIVRRADEGARPLFAREEIQNPPVDLREDALLERRVISVKPAIEDRDVGRIRARRDEDKNSSREIDINPYSEISAHPSMTLSQRWQSYDSRKTSRILSPEPHAHYRERSLEKLTRPLSQSRDSRSRYKERTPVKEYRNSYGVGSPDVSIRRKESERDDYTHDEPKKYSSRGSSERKDSFYRESSSYRNRSKGGVQLSSYESSERRGRSESRRTLNKLRSLSNEREKPSLPDFSQRPDRYKYDSRIEKPDSIPKGSNYYEVEKNHDDRNRTSFRSRGRGIRGYRARGSPRGFRGRGRFTFRGRTFRSRGTYNPIKRSKSPSLWEHDMFNKMSPNKNEDVNPSSTT